MENRFQLYAGNRPEDLSERLAALLAVPPDDPFLPETVVVQNRGIATFLQQALGRKLGICCNIDFPFLNHLIDDVLHLTLPRELTAELDRFRPREMRFRLFDALLNLEERQEFAAYRAYLDGGLREERARMLAGELAGVFDQYQIYRPEMMLRGGPDDPAQRELWRRISGGTGGRAEIFKRFFQLRGAAAVRNRFHRLHVFGSGSMPPLYLWFFQKLAEFIPVHFLYLTPCRAEWSFAIPACEKKRRPLDRLLRTADDTLENPEASDDDFNVLLTSCGRLGREFFASILEYTDYDPDDPRNHFHEPEMDGTTLLHHLQQDILDGVNRSGKPAVAAEDESICVVNCHHQLREIEILHDELLTRFSRHSDWRAGDVMVMAPDIDAYAPYIKAVFESIPPDSPRYIPFQLGDRLPENDDAIYQAFLSLWKLASGRYTLSEVFTFLSNPAVAEKFGFEPADFELLRILFRENRVAWGIDGTHRSELLGSHVPAFEEQSWQRWRERLFLGFAMRPEMNGREKLFSGILPARFMTGERAALAMRLDEFLEQLLRLAPLLNRPRTPAEWRPVLSRLPEMFFSPDRFRYLAIRQIREAADAVCTDAERAGINFPMAAEMLFAEIEQELRSKDRSSGGFLRGGVTFCAMQPMRNIPHRMICLLGMDEASFPRRTNHFGPDLIWRQPRRGDRSPRLEDRYFFLESLLAAREVLYISYVGQSIIDNEPGPPSSLVSELTNYLTTRYDLSDRKRPLTERHPLQAYSRDYFTGGALHSWSPENFRTARRLMERNEIAPPPFLATPLQPPPEEPGDSPETLPDPTTLYTFFRHPFRWFCRRTLRLQDQFETAELPEDTEKLSPDPLQYSQLRSALLRLELSGLPRTDWVECRQADGSLPPAPFDRLVLESLERECSELLDLPKKEFGGSTVRQLFLSEKRLELPPELQFSEILAAARHDDCTALLLPGKWNGRMAILGILFRLLAGLRRMAQAPGMPLEGVILVCADRIARFPGENSPRIRERAETIRKLYHSGQEEPLRFLPGTSYLLARHQNYRQAWDSTYTGIPGEGDDFTVRLFVPENPEASGELPRWQENARAFFGEAEDLP